MGWPGSRSATNRLPRSPRRTRPKPGASRRSARAFMWPGGRTSSTVSTALTEPAGPCNQDRRSASYDIDKPTADIAALYAPREGSRPCAARGDGVRGRDRRLDRERRAAVDWAGAALLADRSFVGRERLRADVRRLPDAGRPDGRSARTQADVHARARPVLGRLVRGR